jgi:hypothetical protein
VAAGREHVGAPAHAQNVRSAARVAAGASAEVGPWANNALGVWILGYSNQEARDAL